MAQLADQRAGTMGKREMAKPHLVIETKADGAECIHSAWIIAGDRADKCSYAGLSIPLFGRDLIAAMEGARQLEFFLPGDRERYRVEEGAYAVGEYHPRIARPVWEYRPEASMGMPRPESSIINWLPPRDRPTTASALMQLAALKENLERIFRTVAPEPANLAAYGHEIRQVMLVACTEWESECKGVLRANGGLASSDRSTTNDYIKLKDALGLDRYEVEMPMYPLLPPRSPFTGWDANRPTATLPWYQAYNGVKHDRVANFADAKLEHGIDAVAACAIVLHAQYHAVEGWREQISGFVSFTKRPTWSAKQTYIRPPRPSDAWSPVNYQF